MKLLPFRCGWNRVSCSLIRGVNPTRTLQLLSSSSWHSARRQCLPRSRRSEESLRGEILWTRRGSKLSLRKRRSEGRNEEVCIRQKRPTRILWSAYISTNGCVNPSSLFPLAAGGKFPQPLTDSFALQRKCGVRTASLRIKSSSYSGRRTINCGAEKICDRSR